MLFYFAFYTSPACNIKGKSLVLVPMYYAYLIARLNILISINYRQGGFLSVTFKTRKQQEKIHYFKTPKLRPERECLLKLNNWNCSMIPKMYLSSAVVT